MAYATSWVFSRLEIGLQAVDRPSTVKQSELGTSRRAYDNGSNRNGEGEFVYILAGAAIPRGSWVSFGEDSWTASLLAAGASGRCGVAMCALASGEYGWIQVAGKAVALCLSGFVDNGLVHATATSGSVDDAAVLGDRVLGALGASARDFPESGMAEFEIDHPRMQDDVDLSQTFVTFLTYGADPTGVIDATAAVQAALSSGKKVFGTPGTYRITDTLTIASNLDLEMAPDCVLSGTTLASGDILMEGVGTEAATTALTVDPEEGDTTLTMASTTGYAVNDLIRIASDDQYDTHNTDSEFGEIAEVKEVTSGTVLTLKAQVCGGTYATNPVISRITPIRGVRIRGGKMLGADDGSGLIGLSIKLGDDCIVEKTWFYKTSRIAVWYRDTINSHVFQCRMENLEDDQSYGVSFDNACQDSTATENVFLDCRHSLSTNNSSTTKGIPRRILFKSNQVLHSAIAYVALSGGDAIDTHGAAEDIWIEDNSVYFSTSVAINLECRSGRITGNKIYYPTDYGISAHNESDLPGSVTISNNKVFCGGTAVYGIRVDTGARGTEAQYESIQVHDNEVWDASSTSILISTNLLGSAEPVNSVSVTGNHCIRNGGTSSAIYLDSVVNGIVANNVVTLTNAGGQGVRIRNCQDVAVNSNSVLAASGATSFCYYVNSSTAGSCTRISFADNFGGGPAASNLRGILLDSAATDCTIAPLQNFRTCTTNISWGTGTGHRGGYLRGTATFDPGELVDGAGVTTTVTVTGAALGDFARISFSLSLQGITVTAYVTLNTVNVRFQNETGSTINLAEGTLTALVEKG